MFATSRSIDIELVPDVEDRGAPQRVKISEVLGPGKSVLLGMPGAFTPTCNDRHLPGYYKQTDKFKALGVDTVAVVTVRFTIWIRRSHSDQRANSSSVTRLLSVLALDR